MLANCIKSRFLASVLLASVLGVAGVATAVEVGEKAPDFTLASTTGKDISLSGFLGKKYVLIEFYGADFVPVWAANLSARKADYKKFEELNVQLLGISANLPFSQKAFADSLQLPYPLLSDMNQNAIKAYGLPNLVGREIVWRSFFLVDKQGIVQGKWIGEDSAVFSSEVLLKAAQEIVGKPAEDAGEKKTSGMWEG